MGWLRNRFGEGSTHASLTGLFGVASFLFPQYASVLQAIAVATGVAGITLPDPGASDHPAVVAKKTRKVKAK